MKYLSSALTTLLSTSTATGANVQTINAKNDHYDAVLSSTFSTNLPVLKNDSTQPTGRPLIVTRITNDTLPGQGLCAVPAGNSGIVYVPPFFGYVANGVQCSYEACTDDNNPQICDEATVNMNVRSSPTDSPTIFPIALDPTKNPTLEQTNAPMNLPTNEPSKNPSMPPTTSPTNGSTPPPVVPGYPTQSPTTKSPTKSPVTPAKQPTTAPATPSPTAVPSKSPTTSPMQSPSVSSVPTASAKPSAGQPTDSPSETPSTSAAPTNQPTSTSSTQPSTSLKPTFSSLPSIAPTMSTSSSFPTIANFTGKVPASIDFVFNVNGKVNATEVMAGETNQVRVAMKESLLKLSFIVIGEEFGGNDTSSNATKNSTDETMAFPQSTTAASGIGSPTSRSSNNEPLLRRRRARGRVLVLENATSAKVNDVQDVACPPSNTTSPSKCLRFDITILLQMVNEPNATIDEKVEIFEQAMFARISKGWLKEKVVVSLASIPEPPTPWAIIGIIAGVLGCFLMTYFSVDDDGPLPLAKDDDSSYMAPSEP